MSILTIVFLLMFMSSLGGMLFFLFWIGKKGTAELKTGSDYPEGDAMKKYMYMGLLYINPDDPRGWLPKKQPLYGWTVNFRDQKYANLFIILLVCTLLCAWGFAASLL